jgi:hypothetical protein
LRRARRDLPPDARAGPHGAVGLHRRHGARRHHRRRAVPPPAVPFHHGLQRLGARRRGAERRELHRARREPARHALWTLGGVPGEHRTDSLSAAYRNLDKEAAEDVTKRYDDFCSHYELLASRCNPGEPHENGSIEAHNRHLKTALDQALILRGARDFAEIADWRRFVDQVVGRRNRRREHAVRIEAAALRPLPARRTTDFTETVVRVTRTGGFLVHSVFYSAPSRLIGQRLRVHVYDDRIEAFLGATRVVSHPRRRGKDNGARVHQVDYRHVIHALRRKPQALAASVYRDGLFPRTEYTAAWAVLSAALTRRDACRRMVDLLWLAHDEACEVSSPVAKGDHSIHGIERSRSATGLRSLAVLAELELAVRETRRIRRHLIESQLPGGKTLATFDFKALPGVPRARVEALAAGALRALPHSKQSAGLFRPGKPGPLDRGSRPAPTSSPSATAAPARPICSAPSATPSSRPDGACSTPAQPISCRNSRPHGATSPSKPRSPGSTAST